jgi:hypothetical protein
MASGFSLRINPGARFEIYRGSVIGTKRALPAAVDVSTERRMLSNRRKKISDNMISSHF